MEEKKCQFCKKEVKTEYESIHGCYECINDWIQNSDIDHDID